MRVNPVIARMNWLILFSLLLVPLHGQAQELRLTGIASYEELNKQYYIAAYYSDAARSEQQMIIKVKPKRWSARKWKAQWQNNIAINNQASDNVELNRALAAFTELPQKALRAEDEVRIWFHPDKGTRVYFNEAQVLSAQGPELFNYLLNTWTGKFSPSRDFRDRITGHSDIETSLIMALEQPIQEGRKDIVIQWRAEEQRKAKAQQLAQKKKAQEKAELEKKKRLAAAKAKAEKERKTKQAAEQLKVQRQQAEQRSRAQALKKQQTDKEKQQQRQRQQQDQQRKQALLQDYWSQLYHWQLQKTVDETVSYPPWAKQFSQQGLVKLEYIFDAGGQVLARMDRSEDASDILIQEVDKRFVAALQEVKRPEKLEGDQWKFLIQYQFKLRGERTLVMKAPVKPEFLK